MSLFQKVIKRILNLGEQYNIDMDFLREGFDFYSETHARVYAKVYKEGDERVYVFKQHNSMPVKINLNGVETISGSIYFTLYLILSNTGEHIVLLRVDFKPDTSDDRDQLKFTMYHVINKLYIDSFERTACIDREGLICFSYAFIEAVDEFKHIRYPGVKYVRHNV